MIVYICDCCKKEIKNNERISCLIPIEEEYNIMCCEKTISTYSTGLFVPREVDLCPQCAELIANFYNSLKKDN